MSAQQRVVAFGDSPRLEGRLFVPSGEPIAGVILTHPHPKLGGDLRNNVVQALAWKLADEGFVSLAFNFRGVGRSGGTSTWNGRSEITDVVAAVDFLKKETNVSKVFLVGYSFGAAVACSVNQQFDAYVAISYPKGCPSCCMLGHLYPKADGPLPKLFIVGGSDWQFANGLADFVKNLQPPAELKVIPGVDHFWFQEEDRLYEPIVSFLRSHL